MKNVKMARFLGSLTWLPLAFLLIWPAPATAALEETFDVLQIGAKTYKNVTVTTKAKSYIFILHSSGMTNIKVADLPPELREKLGYTDGTPQKSQASNAAAWAKKTLPALKLPQLEQVERSWREHAPAAMQNIPLNARLLYIVGGITVLAFLFFCYCSRLICQKTGNEPGVLIWLPGFQIFPLLRAAGMPPLWCLAWLVPVLNVVAQIVWSVKIAQARGKNVWVGILLLLPVINLFAFLHLAFSNGTRAEKEERVVEIMTLETA